MKCNIEGCFEEAVTFHGITTTTHGYCKEHRCCYRCGLGIIGVINMVTKNRDSFCTCKEGPMERPEYKPE
jgi:hypothetical protein